MKKGILASNIGALPILQECPIIIITSLSSGGYGGERRGGYGGEGGYGGGRGG